MELCTYEQQEHLYIYIVYIVNMVISTVSVRVPEEIKQDLKHFEQDEKLTQISEAARKLLLLGLETWRKEKALTLLQQGKVTFSKAAQIAKMNVWEFSELVKEKKITWIKDSDLVKNDLEAA